jgi:CDP-glycerol glycerophosphotransferase (TagB/SpsB family)
MVLTKTEEQEKQNIFDEVKFLMKYFSIYEILKFLSFIPLNIFKYMLYSLSILIPRRKDIWVFGSWKGEKFFDNSKYMFLFMSNNHKEITSIWISKNKDIVKKLKEQNYDAYYTYSLKGMYYNLRAKYIISDSSFNSVNFWCCGGATKIQLWHGLMLKYQGKNNKLPWSKPLGKLIYRYFDPWLFTKNDYVTCSSDFFIDQFATTFDIEKEKIIVTGFARNDVIFKHIKGENLIDTDSFNKMNKLRSLNPNSKIILYMPTFRDKELFSKKSTDFSTIFNFTELNKFLEEVNGYFIIKPHPDTNINLKDQGRIVVVQNKNFDIYPCLSQIDLLITDYSSIYFDFLMTNKPIIFYFYDLEDYVKSRGEMLLNYDEFAPGPKPTTFKDLLYWMNYFIKGNDEFIDERKKIMELSFNNIDGNSSERIYEYMSSLK